jgi:hypothetical protein
MAPSSWFVLGFTSDDIVVAGQDWRLAEECVRAWRAAGRPPGFSILYAGGDGVHMLYWFVNEAAARVLDERSVQWRNRVVGTRPQPPKNGHNVLKAESE